MRRSELRPTGPSLAFAFADPVSTCAAAVDLAVISLIAFDQPAANTRPTPLTARWAEFKSNEN